MDSNIFRGDLLLRSKEIDIMLFYLQKTDSRVVIPQLVFEEIKELYRKVVTERVREYSKAKNNLRLSIIEMPILEEINIDIDKEIGKYIEYVYQRFSLDESDIFPYKNEYLGEVVNRAIQRKKPCGEDGQGFRDAILWLSILDYACEVYEKQIVFISNNTKDFADSKNVLHGDLIQDAQNKNVSINYFVSVKDFIAEHTVKIDFVTHAWLETKLIELKYEQILFEYAENHSDEIKDWINHKLKPGKELTNYINALQFNQLEIASYNIYEMNDDTYRIFIEVICEIEIEYEYEEFTEDPFDFDVVDFYDKNRKKYYTGLQPNPTDSGRYEYIYDYEYPVFDVELVLTIKNKLVKTFEIGKWKITN